MKNLFSIITACVFIGLVTFSCQQDIIEDKVSPEVINQLEALGFNPEGIEIVEEGYRIENDIIITEEFLSSNPSMQQIPNTEQYSTNNLVATGGSRTINVYIDAPGCSAGNTISSNPGNARGGNGGGKPGGGGSTQFDQDYADALDDAISRFNAENLELTFARVCDASSADIVYSRLNKRDERRGILGSAGFPTNGGDPYGTVNMSGIIISTYGWSVDAVATVMAHEMGHCIGFRHTDYFDRSLSCGGGTSNEGDAGIGANHIPGTPTGFSANSFMLACTGGGNRPFNNADKTALDYLY